MCTPLPASAFRYTGNVATRVLPSPVFISAILPECRTMPPIICTSKWRMPTARLPASRTTAKASGSSSSSASVSAALRASLFSAVSGAPSSRAAKRALNSVVFSRNSASESPWIFGSHSLMAATVGIMRLTTRSLFVPKILVNALLIKEFLWALRQSGLTPSFYAITASSNLPVGDVKKAARLRRCQAARENPRVPLKGVTQAELQLPVRAIGLSLARHLPEGTGGRIVHRSVIVRTIPVGMVGEVECLRPEGQHMVVVCRDHVEVLFQRRIPALEAGSVDQVAAAPRRERSSIWRRRKRRGIEPVALSAKLLRHVRRLHRGPELVARTRANSGIVGAVGHAERLARLRLRGSRKLPVPQRPAGEAIAQVAAIRNVPHIVHHQRVPDIEIAGAIVDTGVVVIRQLIALVRTEVHTLRPGVRHTKQQSMAQPPLQIELHRVIHRAPSVIDLQNAREAAVRTQRIGHDTG